MKKYRCVLWILFSINLMVLSFLFVEYCNKQLPNSIQLTTGETAKFQYNIPVEGEINHQKIKLNEPFTITKNSVGQYQINTKLFGTIPLKKIKVNIVKETKVIPSGKIVGIYVETKGILVLDTETITGLDQVNHSPSKQKLRKGDYILSVNGASVATKAELVKQINHAKNKEIQVDVLRNENQISVHVTPVQSIKDHQYKLGIWVRDNTQGIGTLTFTTEKTFGGLGHGICDIDTGFQMSIKGGYLLTPTVDTIKKGEKGDPGEIIGSIYYKEAEFIGTITKNTNYGIFGQLLRNNKEPAYSLGYKQEVKTGKAQIISCISGKKKRYDIKINKVDQSNHEILKGIEIEVTDPKLLKLTNGIVQGMSGSPIMQNGKIIGAVTHVFVNNPRKGYGIFIESMLKQTKQESTKNKENS